MLKISPSKHAHELMRRKVWLDAYCAVASAVNSDGVTSLQWADEALKQFDIRFVELPEIQQDNQPQHFST